MAPTPNPRPASPGRLRAMARQVARASREHAAEDADEGLGRDVLLLGAGVEGLRGEDRDVFIREACGEDSTDA